MNMLLRLANDPDCPEGRIAGDPGGYGVYFRGSNLDYIDIWNAADFEAAVHDESTLIIRYNVALASFLRDGVTEHWDEWLIDEHAYHPRRISDREVLLIHPSIAQLPVIQRQLDSL
jgi:hypothetical protein